MKTNLTPQDIEVLLRKVEEEECEHEFDPDEGFTCLNCGKDGAEEVFSRAYDRAKDRRKYGS